MVSRADSTTRLHFWRPVPREVADLTCAEGTVDELPMEAYDAIQVMLPASRFAVVDATGGAMVVHPGQVYIAAPRALTGAHGVNGAECAMRLVLVAPSALSTAAYGWENTAASGHRQLIADDAALYAELWKLVGALRGPLVGLASAIRLLRRIDGLLAGLTPRPPHAPARRAPSMALAPHACHRQSRLAHAWRIDHSALSSAA